MCFTRWMQADADGNYVRREDSRTAEVTPLPAYGAGAAQRVQFVAAFVLVQGVFAFTTGNATIAVPAILAAIAVVGAIICANSRDSLAYVSPGSAAARR